jgi:hypothetical protein
MQLIFNNPYRILGILVGATAKEQSKQKGTLKSYIAAGQDPPVDYSFPALGRLPNAIEAIDEANSKLNLDSDKMNAALFWFYKGNEITDEPAFDALKDGDTDAAMQIWEKLTLETKDDGKKYWKEITEKNHSAFHNWFILGFLSKINWALIANLKFLESDYWVELKKRATDETFKTTKKELQLNFLTNIVNEIEKKNVNLSLAELVNLLSNESFSAKQDFLKSLAQKFTSNITGQIETARKQRTANKANAAKAGENLYKQTEVELGELRNIFGTQDFNYYNIADKVANEVLQCGIDYFNHFKDSNTDPGSAVTDLFKKVQSLAVGNITKQRCKENIEGIQEWINDKPEREKQERIKNDFDFIAEKLKHQTMWKTIADAKDLAVSCKPRLDNIKMVLGSYDNLYIQLSSAVVGNAQGMLVSAVNQAQENFQLQVYLNRLTALNSLKHTIREALEVTNLLDTFDMDSNLRSRYNINKNTMQNTFNQLNTIKGKGSSSSGDCYIATMAYGSYEHPQVMILRQFRDTVLDKSILGKWFIKAYYRYSPTLVEKLKDKKTANDVIRKILNMLIKIINK